MNIYELVNHELEVSGSSENSINTVFDCCDKHYPNPIWTRLKELDYPREQKRLISLVEKKLTRDSISNSIKSFYVGIAKINGVLDFFIEGVESESTKKNKTSLKKGLWYWPNNPYLKPTIPETIETIFNECDTSGLPLQISEFVINVFYACLVCLELAEKTDLFKSHNSIEFIVQREGTNVSLGSSLNGVFSKEIKWVEW